VAIHSVRDSTEETVGNRPRGEGFALIGLGVGARLIGMAAGALAGLATTALAVRLLGTESYGVFAFAFSAAAVFGGVGRLGLEPAVARSTAIMRSSGDLPGMAGVARGAFTLVAMTALAGTAATLAVIELKAHGLGNGDRLVLGGFLGLLLYGSNVTAVGAGLPRATGRVALMEVSILVPALGKLAAVAVLTGFGLADVRWVAAGYAAGALGGVAAAWGAARLVLGRCRVLVPDLGAARKMLASSLPFAVVGLATIVISRFDVLVLGVTGTRSEVGAYEPALKVVEQAMLLVPLLFAAQYLPVASRAFTRGDRAEFRELYVGVSKLAFVIASPAVILFAAFPEAVLRALYGPDFPAGGLVVWLLLPGFVVNLAFGLNSSALSAIGDRRLLARTGLIATASMIVLALALVPPFGAKGAAVATSLTYAVLNVVVSMALVRAGRVYPVRRDFALTILSALGPLAAALLIRASVDAVGVWEAIGFSVGLAAAWVALLFALRVLRLREVTRLLPGGR
jgi:O-antigen/teichoic acid export membrane protein